MHKKLTKKLNNTQTTIVIIENISNHLCQRSNNYTTKKPPVFSTEGTESIELYLDYAARALRANHQSSFIFSAVVALYDYIIVGFPYTLIIFTFTPKVNHKYLPQGGLFVDSDSDFCTFILKEIKELIAAATEEQCKEILLSLKTLGY